MLKTLLLAAKAACREYIGGDNPTLDRLIDAIGEAKAENRPYEVASEIDDTIRELADDPSLHQILDLILTAYKLPKTNAPAEAEEAVPL